MSKYNSDNHAMVELIDIIRDLNKSISMHVDNHNAKHVDTSIMNVARKASNKLANLTEHFDRAVA